MSSFDEEPDGDPHGECTAEIARLAAKVSELERELADMTRKRDALFASNLMSASELCRKHHVQKCDSCDDLGCCDNTSPAKKRVADLEAQLHEALNDERRMRMKEQIEGPPQWWRVAWHRLMVKLFSRRWSRKPQRPNTP